MREAKLVSGVLGGFPRSDIETECLVNIGEYWLASEVQGEGTAYAKGLKQERASRTCGKKEGWWSWMQRVGKHSGE